MQIICVCRFFVVPLQPDSILRMAVKLKYLLAVLCCGIAVSMPAQSKQTKTEPSAMRTSLLLNLGVSDCKQPALGLTIAGADKYGYYVNFMIGLDNLHPHFDYYTADDGSLIGGDYAGMVPFYSGKRAYNRLSATGGALVRMKIPLFVYAGIGYGYRTETRELLNRQWVASPSSLHHSVVLEAGLIGRLENITLQAGYTVFVGGIGAGQSRLYHEAKIGLGYTFDK